MGVSSDADSKIFVAKTSSFSKIMGRDGQFFVILCGRLLCTVPYHSSASSMRRIWKYSAYILIYCSLQLEIFHTLNRKIWKGRKELRIWNKYLWEQKLNQFIINISEIYLKIWK